MTWNTNEYAQAAKARLDQMAKPLDSLGEFENIICKLAAITNRVDVSIAKRRLIIMCADNGIVQEGVTQTGQEVTLAVAKEMAKGTANVCVLAKQAGVDVLPVDIGIASEEEVPGLLPRKIRPGTANFFRASAMSMQEMQEAFCVGVELAKQSKQEGYELLALGEMGIGNTTTSAAMASAMLRLPVEQVTGRGAGLSDAGLQRKIEVISQALHTYGMYWVDWDHEFDEWDRRKAAGRLLATVGGLDIAGLAGVCVGAARVGLPVLLDGLITAVAALTAEWMEPGVKNILLASHMGKEPAMRKIMEELELSPVVHAGLALGEGTGAMFALPMIDMALQLYRQGPDFEGIAVEQYRRFASSAASANGDSEEKTPC